MNWISPEAMHLIIQIRDWVAPGAVALVCFFFIRYITHRDKFETDIELKFEKHTNKFSETLTAHANRVTEASGKFENAVLEVKGQAADMRKSNLEFQSAVNEKLIDIEKRSIGIEGTLERTAEKANQLEAKVDETLQKVEAIVDKVQFHDRAVGDLLKKHAESEHRLDIIRTDVTQLKRKTKKH